VAQVEVLVDDAPAFTIAVPNTGGYEAFADAAAPERAVLPAGPHTITIRFPVGSMNLDRFAFRADGPGPLPGGAVPLDTDGDGLFEDVNGNGGLDFADVVLCFNSMSAITAEGDGWAFDFNGNGRMDFADVVWLFNRI
jgi:hypothetical protein